jgi:hypothetical protein
MSHSLALDKQWYEFLEEVAGAFYNAMSRVRARKNETAPLSPLLTVRGGYAESPGWLMVQAAEFDPEPLTMNGLRVRHVYGSERIFQALLELMASERWFNRNAVDEYALIPAGQGMLERIFARRRGWLEALDVGMDDTVAEIEGTLRALIEASLLTADMQCLKRSRRRAHLQETSPLGKIFQYLEDFNAIRDDAHMAGWQPTGVKGYEWETFTFVSDEKATNAEALFEQLHYRGYTRAEFADALTALAWRSWLERAEGENYRATSVGRETRAGVEHKTDEYFYAPWNMLSEGDLARLHSNLEMLRDALLAFAA